MHFPHIDMHKPHPLLIGGIIIVGAVVLFSYLKGGSKSGGTTVVSSGPSAAATSANTALQIAQMQGNYALAGMKLQADAATHTADLAAGVKAKEDDNTLAAILATLQGQQAMGQLALTAQSNDNSAQIQAAQIAADLAKTQIAAEQTVTLKTIQLQDTKYARDQYDFQTQTRLADDLANRQLVSNTTLMQQLLASITALQPKAA